MADQILNIEHLVLKRTLDYVELLISAQEPLKALQVLQELSPACVERHPDLLAVKERVQDAVAHVYNKPELYVARYKGLNLEQVEPLPNFATPSLLQSGRGMRTLSALEGAAEKGNRVDVLCVGAWDCTLEKAMLELAPNIHVTISELTDLGSRATQELKELFPGRVETDSRYDTVRQRNPELEHKFDFVVCLEVMEHVASPNQLLLNFGYALKPTGTLLMSVPEAGHWVEPHAMWSFAKGEWFGHVRMYTARSFRKELLDVFDEVTITLDNGVMFTYARTFNEFPEEVVDNEAQLEPGELTACLNTAHGLTCVYSPEGIRDSIGDIKVYKNLLIEPTRMCPHD